MTKVTWQPGERSGMTGLMPHRDAVDHSGRRVAFVRELATHDGYRVSLFPDGDHNHSIEGRVSRDEDFAVKMATVAGTNL